MFKKSLITFLTVCCMVQSKAQEQNSRLFAGFHSDVFIIKSFNYTPGLKAGYQYHFDNDRSFLRIGGSLAFGKGKNAHLTVHQYNPGNSIVTTNYKITTGWSGLQFGHFFSGYLNDYGWYATAGLGAQMHFFKYDGFTSDHYDYSGPTTPIFLVTPNRFITLGYLAGIGYYYSFNTLDIFAEINGIGSVGKDEHTFMRDAKLHYYPVHAGITLGVIFKFTRE